MRRRHLCLLYLPTLLLVLLSGLGETFGAGAFARSELFAKAETARRANMAYFNRAARGQVPYDAAEAARAARFLQRQITGEMQAILLLSDWLEAQTRITAALALGQLAIGGWYWRRRGRRRRPDRADGSVEQLGRAA